MLRPIELMWARVERGREDSDTALFLDLLYTGEMVLRITTAAFVAGVQEDRDRHKYRLLHRLVRADGIGDWSQVLDDALTGSASQHLSASLREDRREILENLGSDTWQFRAVMHLHETLAAFVPDVEPLPSKVSLRRWFGLFPVLRNKTRAHGAPTAALCSHAAPSLEKSIRLITEKPGIFHKQWAYLHRNLSGKYRVLSLDGDVSSFSILKTTSARTDATLNIPDGTYVWLDGFSRIDLLFTSVDLNDFFLPNGNFNERTFELHSLITDNRMEGDATAYLTPAGERPASETQGQRQLDVVGNTWTNLPSPSLDYVVRPLLEFEVLKELKNDRHAIVTLVGRGGIGKTSLAVRALHDIAHQDAFEFIFWFSARDIDLLPSGPKVVKPHVLTEKDIADEFLSLIGPVPASDAQKSTSYLAKCMSTPHLGRSALFVFDNFETVRSPVDLFNWIDMNIRLPNKVLITSRLREFRADYPIEIGGMERSEADKLVDLTAKKLGVADLVTEAYRDSIFDESEGHPYVIKIIVGEIASSKRIAKPERIIARKEEILDALFERTYATLTPAARRVFLTLCAWKSLVPQLALEAVLLRPENERMDAGGAVDELVRMSLVERNPAADGTDFLAVPLAAAIFGERKLSASPIKSAIEADVRMLQDVGPTTGTGLREGIRPRVNSLFRRIAARVSDGKVAIDDMRPVLEFVSRDYAPGWLMMADLYEERGDEDGLYQAAESVRRFLETAPSPDQAMRAWERLAELYVRLRDIPSASDAFVRALEFEGVPFSSISNTANWLNNHRSLLLEQERTEREQTFTRLIRIMENRLNEATATDLSRLAWLYLPRETGRALALAQEGLAREPQNQHCSRLVERLQSGV